MARVYAASASRKRPFLKASLPCRSASGRRSCSYLLADRGRLGLHEGVGRRYEDGCVGTEVVVEADVGLATTERDGQPGGRSASRLAEKGIINLFDQFLIVRKREVDENVVLASNALVGFSRRSALDSHSSEASELRTSSRTELSDDQRMVRKDPPVETLLECAIAG